MRAKFTYTRCNGMYVVLKDQNYSSVQNALNYVHYLERERCEILSRTVRIIYRGLLTKDNDRSYPYVPTGVYYHSMVVWNTHE
jgi:hypothetical protein